MQKDLHKILNQNISNLQERIQSACERAGRKQESVKLVISTKYVQANIIKILYELGITCIGENRLQDTEQKIKELNGLDLHWHMFGHLQRNKVKKAIRIFDLIHSVESISLAEEINKESLKIGKKTKILVEVNISGEQTKYGLSTNETIPFLQKISKMDGLSVEGLMTMAPIVEDAETCRPIFSGLRELNEQIKEERINGIQMNCLSMGMTQDFEVAIEEGANMIRVGSAIFKGI